MFDRLKVTMSGQVVSRSQEDTFCPLCLSRLEPAAKGGLQCTADRGCDYRYFSRTERLPLGISCAPGLEEPLSQTAMMEEAKLRQIKRKSRLEKDIKRSGVDHIEKVTPLHRDLRDVVGTISMIDAQLTFHRE